MNEIYRNMWYLLSKQDHRDNLYFNENDYFIREAEEILKRYEIEKELKLKPNKLEKIELKISKKIHFE